MFNKLSISISVASGIVLLIVAVVFASMYQTWVKELPTLFVLVILCLIVFVMYLVFLFYIWKPIHKINVAIKTLLSWWEYVDIDIRGNNEIGIIWHFINQIVRKVKDLSDELFKWRRVMGEVNAASEIQKSILPTIAPNTVIGLDAVAKSRACSEVWGDSFDIIEAWKSVYFFVWDVTGHWVPASLIMAIANTAVRAFIDGQLDSKSIMIKTNQLLFDKIKTNHFMSAVFLRWDNEIQKMYYTWVGHETILLYKYNTQKVENIKSGWIALKMVKDISSLIEEKEISFEVWDCIVLYSDWIIDAKNQLGERYWVDSLIKVIERNWIDNANNVFKEITKDFSRFVQWVRQIDDITLIVIKNVWQHWAKWSFIIWSSQDNIMGISPSNWSWE